MASTELEFKEISLPELEDSGVIYAGPMRNGLPGMQVMYRFPNGYGASIIRGGISYGLESGLWELAVVHFYGAGVGEWSFAYDSGIADDVLGWLSPEDVDDILEKIVSLPPRESNEITA